LWPGPQTSPESMADGQRRGWNARFGRRLALRVAQVVDRLPAHLRRSRSRPAIPRYVDPSRRRGLNSSRSRAARRTQQCDPASLQPPTTPFLPAPRVSFEVARGGVQVRDPPSARESPVRSSRNTPEPASMKDTKDIPQGVQFIEGGSPYRERAPQCRKPQSFDNLLGLS
jgi:hypothetical protein